MIHNTSPTVDQMEQVSIKGNVIPKIWYQRLKYKNKRGSYPHLLAINILSELVYWYKPTLVVSEETGKIISKQNKFKADKLQKNYKQLSELFGVSYKLAREAVIYLCERHMIKTELRNINIAGTTLQNVMFIEVIPANVNILSNSADYPIGIKPITQLDKDQSPNSIITDYPIGQKPITQLGSTYTESTTDSTTKKTTYLNCHVVTSILEKFNELAGKKVYVTGQRSSKNRKDVWNTLHRKGKNYSKEEIISVIQLKSFEWSWNPEMNQYLQISTVFRASNFDKYIQQVEDLKVNKHNRDLFIKKINDNKISLGIISKSNNSKNASADIEEYYS